MMNHRKGIIMTEDEFINKIQKLQEPDESFIYFWMHPVLNLKYIGSHHGNPDDGYTGSGIDFKEQLKKNPIEEWDRIILAYTSGDKQYEIEQLFLKFFNVANDPNFLNRTDIAEGLGIGEDNCNYKDGLLIGRPQPRDGYQKIKEWKNSLPEERLEKVLEKESKQRIQWYNNLPSDRKEKLLEQNRQYKKEHYKNNKEKIRQSKKRRRTLIQRIIEMDNTYTKEYFKGMKMKEVLKIEENLKKNIKNNSNSLERFL